MKRTPWFPVGINPVHVGDYDYRLNFGEVFGHHDERYTWDGKRWRTSGGQFVIPWQTDQWRGLTTPEGR